MDNYVITKAGLKKESNVNENDCVWGDGDWVKVTKIADVIDGNIIQIDNGLTVFVNRGSYIESYVKNKFSQPCVGDSINVGFATTQFCGDDNLIFKNHNTDIYVNNGNRLKTNLQFPNSLNKNFSYLLGYSYGDGCVEYRSRDGVACKLSLSCSDEYPDIKNKLVDELQTIYNTVRIKRGCGSLDVVSLNSVEFIENLKNNNILKQKAGCLIYPEKILHSSMKNQISFLEGFFDADGCAQQSKKSFKITIIDKQILQIFQLQLLLNGILSTFGDDPITNQGEWKNKYRINITGRLSVKLFQQIFSESYKVKTANIVTKRDSNVTIYNIKDFNLKSNCHKSCNSNSNISYSVFNDLQELGMINPNTPCYILKKIIKIEPSIIPRKIIHTENDKKYWCNGVYLKNMTIGIKN